MAGDDYLKPLLDLAAAVGTKSVTSAMKWPGQIEEMTTTPIRDAALVGDVVTGKVDPMSDEGVKRAVDLAGSMMLGGAGGEAPAGSLRMFAGRTAKTANHAQLAAAEKMAAEGTDRRAIWDATGWFQGVDGKWRFEIPDHEAEVRGYIMPGSAYEGQLSGIMKHRNAYMAYDDLPAIPAEYGGSGAASGSYFPPNGIGDELITISKRAKDPLSTALHEAQHAIQQREGFATGANGMGALRPDTPAWDIYQGLLKRMQTPLSHETFSKAANYEGLAPKRDYDAYVKMVKKDAKKWDVEAQKTAVQEAYRRSAGEVEARNVQKRMSMTPEERAATPPWETQDVLDDQQIVHHRASGGRVPRHFPVDPERPEDYMRRLISYSFAIARMYGKANGGEVDGYAGGGRKLLDAVKLAQKITSADTSIKQVPALFKSKHFDVQPGFKNLDIGGGKYDLGADYLRNERGVESHVYDPFNRPEEHNEKVLGLFQGSPADSVTAANVLNVIQEPEARAAVVQQALDALRPGGRAYFGIYEGNKTGTGAATTKGWQENRPAATYLDEVRALFPEASRRGNIIIAPKPEKAGGGALLEDKYPSHFMPGVGRQVMADGGAPSYSAPITGQHTITLDDLIGRAPPPSGAQPGAYTDAGGQKIDAPFVTSLAGGYPVAPTANPAVKGEVSSDPLARFRDLFGRTGFADGGVKEVENAMRVAKDVSDQESMSHPVGMSGSVDFAPVRLREPLSGYELPIGSVPKETAAIANPMLDMAVQGVPWLAGPAVGGAYDFAVGMKEGDMASAAMGAMGLPGRAAKAAGIVGSTLAAEDAEGAALQRLINMRRGLGRLYPEGSGYQSVPGKPSVVDLPGIGRVEARPIPEVDRIAEQFRRRVNPMAAEVNSFAPLNPAFASKVASAFDAMKHEPYDPVVRRAYEALIDDTMSQYRAARDTGVDIRFLKPGQADPYAESPALGYEDIVNNGRLFVFPTDQGFGTLNAAEADNPLLRRVGRVGDKDDAVANDAFRVVHDLYGHFGPGNPFFRAPGEERAYQLHSGMFSKEALPAATAETRGQNSWVNYGPFGQQNRTATGADTVYADQKIGKLPDWASAPPPAEDVDINDYIRNLVRRAVGGRAGFRSGGVPGLNADVSFLEDDAAPPVPATNDLPTFARSPESIAEGARLASEAKADDLRAAASNPPGYGALFADLLIPALTQSYAAPQSGNVFNLATQPVKAIEDIGSFAVENLPKAPEAALNAVRSIPSAAEHIAKETAKSIYSGLTLAGDVLANKVDPMSDEGFKRVQDLAGLAFTGSIGGASPPGALNSGLKLFDAPSDSTPLARTFFNENVPSAVVSPRPGKGAHPPIVPEPGLTFHEPAEDYMDQFSFATPSILGAGLPPAIQAPARIEPRMDALVKSVYPIFRTPKFQEVVEQVTGLPRGGLSITPTVGTWLGEREPSFIFEHPEMTPGAADRLSQLLGFGMQQDAAVAFHHNPDLFGGMRTILVGNGKKLNQQQIQALAEQAAQQGVDFTLTKDRTAAKFLYTGDENEYPAFLDKIQRLSDATGMTEGYNARSKSSLFGANEYIPDILQPGRTRGLAGLGSGEAGLQGGSSGSSDLFGGIVDHILAPYGRAVAGEGYRFSPERLGQIYGLSPDQVDRVRRAMLPRVSTNPKKDRSTIPLMRDEQSLDIRPTSASGKPSVDDVLFALQNRAAKQGQVDPGDFSREAARKIAQDIAREVAYHTETEGKSAIGWYDAALKKAKALYHTAFPELATDKNAELHFDALLGITSQGNDVYSNSVFAARLYSLLRGGASLPEAVKKLSGSFGQQTNAIEDNLLKFHRLIEKNGVDRMRQLFNERMTVSEWNSRLRKDPEFKIGGSPLEMQGAANQKVTGWMVFGPKIGSFINNLHGDYSTLTADLWFSRTWNRLLGHNFIHSPVAEQKQFQDFRDAMRAEFEHHNSFPWEQRVPHKTSSGQFVVDKSSGRPKPWLHGEDLRDMPREQFEQMINDPDAVFDFAKDVYGRYVDSGYKDKSDLRRRAKNWMENRENPVAAPRGDKERDFQQQTVELAQKILRDKYGKGISVADIQAALWFHEKELFSKLGVASERAQPADYSDAAQRTLRLLDEGNLFTVFSKQKKAPKQKAGGGSVIDRALDVVSEVMSRRNAV